MTIPDDQREKLVRLLSNVAGNAQWSWPSKHGGGPVISPILRAIYRERGPHPGSVRVHLYSLHDDPLPLGYESLATMLRQMLARYISPKSDLIGYGLVDLVGGLVPTKFDAFVKELIRGATLLGTEEAVTFLSDWLEQKPYDFECHGIIQDAKLVGQPRPERGMQIKTLPTSSLDFPNSLVAMTFGGPDRSWFGGCVLSVRCRFVPDFFVPPESGRRRESDRPRPFFPDYPEQPRHKLFERIGIAMSLATNSNVGLTPQWSDYGDLQAFRQTQGGGVISRGTHSGVKVTDSTIHDTLEILDVLPTEPDAGNKTVVAMDFLILSFGGFHPMFKFAATRTALDILFAPPKGTARDGIRKGKADLLANKERDARQVREDLCGFYKLASKVVHGESSGDTEAARVGLGCAQADVKRAILMGLEKERAESRRVFRAD